MGFDEVLVVKDRKNADFTADGLLGVGPVSLPSPGLVAPLCPAPRHFSANSRPDLSSVTSHTVELPPRPSTRPTRNPGTTGAVKSSMTHV
ncbi:hypothetical protein AHiyo4_19430 [Arthrobacter sp. Hiyo4]|nr:hypothetical protein AHiyo4_19430 [Arthrobacter sp. Hiyo4]